MKSCLLHSGYNLRKAQKQQPSFLVWHVRHQSACSHMLLAFIWPAFSGQKIKTSTLPTCLKPGNLLIILACTRLVLPQACIKAAPVTGLLTCSITYKFNTDDESFEWYDLRNRNQDECKILKGKVDVLSKVAQHQQPAQPNGLPVNGSKPPRKPGTYPGFCITAD